MTTSQQPIGERMATLEAWSSGHDKICGDRYRLLMRVITAGISILIAVAGAGVGALYKNVNDQAAGLQVAIHSLEIARAGGGTE